MYQPNEDDIRFAKCIMKCSDGVLVRIPSADLVYRKQQKNLVLVCGNSTSETHLRTIDVFRHIGVEVDVAISPRALVMSELRAKVLRGNAKILCDAACLQDLHNLLNAHRNN